MRSGPDGCPSVPSARNSKKGITVYQRILLAYDGSIEGRTALREGALLARRYGAQVFVLSVIREAAGTKLGEGVGGGARVDGGVGDGGLRHERRTRREDPTLLQ